MIDDVGAGAAKAIIESGLLGALLILSLAGLAVVVKLWRSDIAKLEARLMSEVEAHNKTREAHMADVRNLANVGEALNEMRTDLVRLAMGRNPT